MLAYAGDFKLFYGATCRGLFKLTGFQIIIAITEILVLLRIYLYNL